MPLSLILFDIDDTLIDFAACEKLAFRNAFARVSRDTDDEVLRTYRSISRELWKELERGGISSDKLVVERFRRLFDVYNWPLDPGEFNGIYIEELSLTGFLIPGALEILKELRPFYNLGLVTNGIAPAQRGRIKVAGIDSYFSHVFISEEVGFAKPSPAFFKRALEGSGVTDAGSVLIVGDSLSADIGGGLSAGLWTCHYNPKALQNTSAVKPHYEISHLRQVSDVVRALEERMARGE